MNGVFCSVPVLGFTSPGPAALNLEDDMSQYLEDLKEAAEAVEDDVLDELLLELVDGALLGDGTLPRDRVPLLDRLT